MSSNLLKWGYTNLQQDEKRVIDTNELIAARIEALGVKMSEPENEGFREGLSAEELDVAALLEDTEEGAENGNVIKATSIEDMMAAANEEAQGLINQAAEEAEMIRETAMREAQEDAERIMQDAREQGYQDGVLQAKSEYEAKLSELDVKQRQMEAEYEELLSTIEPQMVEHLSAIYEHLFHVELAEYKDILIHLISDTMHRAENSRDFLIRVSKADYPAVVAQRENLEKEVVFANSTLEILEDVMLKENECMIETENGIYDCGLDTQLTLLRKRLRLLSFEK